MAALSGPRPVCCESYGQAINVPRSRRLSHQSDRPDQRPGDDADEPFGSSRVSLLNSCTQIFDAVRQICLPELFAIQVYKRSGLQRTCIVRDLFNVATPETPGPKIQWQYGPVGPIAAVTPAVSCAVTRAVTCAVTRAVTRAITCAVARAVTPAVTRAVTRAVTPAVTRAVALHSLAQSIVQTALQLLAQSLE